MTKTATKTRTATRTAAKHLDTFKGINSALGATGRWPTQLAGQPVTAEQVTAASGLCKRNGTAKHLGLAMALRADGATQPEIMAATGDTQVNAIAEAVRGKLATAIEVGRRNGHKVYKLALVTAKPKAPRKAKAKADKPATPDQPAS